MMAVRHLFDNRPLAETLLSNWAFDPDDPSRFERYRISSNAIYPFQSHGAAQFLRFAPATEKRLEAIRAELDFISYLRANGYPAAEPVPAKSGDLVVAQKTVWGTYYATVFRGVSGMPLSETGLDDTVVRRYGHALGGLHRLSADYRPTAAPRWSHADVLVWIGETLSHLPDTSEAASEVGVLAQHFASLPLTPASYGLNHYDFECDNVFFDAATRAISVIDFDDAMYHWYAMDLEQALDSLVGGAPAASADVFMAGYALERPDGLDELQALRPACRRFADLYWYARVRRALAETLADEPEWLIGLRTRLAPRVKARAERFGAPPS